MDSLGNDVTNDLALSVIAALMAVIGCASIVVGAISSTLNKDRIYRYYMIGLASVICLVHLAQFLLSTKSAWAAPFGAVCWAFIAGLNYLQLRFCR